MKILTKERIENYSELIRLQKMNIQNEYMMGVYNGMLLIYSDIMDIKYKPLKKDEVKDILK